MAENALSAGRNSHGSRRGLSVRSVMLDWSDGESAPRIEEVSTLLRAQAIFTILELGRRAWQ